MQEILTNFIVLYSFCSDIQKKKHTKSFIYYSSLAQKVKKLIWDLLLCQVHNSFHPKTYKEIEVFSFSNVLSAFPFVGKS